MIDPALIAESGKSEAELRKMLFGGTNSIDFDGDGESGEYGSNNVRRISQKVTGGCLNVAEPDLKLLLSALKLGDQKASNATGLCTT